MKSNHSLAIVIPAYKQEFFKQTLKSIANQTCKHFTLYIGDDASPYNLEEIVNSFTSDIDIIYKRFEENIGSKNLVDHWNRCIDLVMSEEWIWFFSDDDLMDLNCVELFYLHIANNPNHRLLHFNLRIINERNEILYKILKFGSFLSTAQFFDKRLKTKIHSCAVEYIFRKEDFINVGRFESFDLAWSSDDATWLKLSTINGIHTVNGAFVSWRESRINISMQSDVQNSYRKIYATINYINWAKTFFASNDILDHSSNFQKAIYPIRMMSYASALSYKEKVNLINNSSKYLNVKDIRLQLFLFWLFFEFKYKIKVLMKNI